MRAAVMAIRQRGAARIVVALPLCAPSTCAELRNEVDDLECARAPEPFFAPGLWYHDSVPPSDADVCRLLAESRRRFRSTAVSDSAFPPPP